LKLLLGIGVNKFFLKNRNFTVEHWFAARAVFGELQMAFLQ
jgi:hypothetical protein